ncbi:MAG: ATPase [Oscillospiraceae bacterium]|nr:ATPase [Oscillospiraceae bacterium]
MEIFVLPLIAVTLLCAPLVYSIMRVKKGKSPKKAFIANLCTFFGVMALAVIFPFGQIVSAAEAQAAVDAVISTGAGIGYLGAGLATGLSCVGAGIAVGSGSSAAIGAVSEDPKSFVKALIFVVLGEGIALYGLLISILIINGLG